MYYCGVGITLGGIVKKNNIKPFCLKVRAILEQTHKHSFSSQTSLYVSDFPSGCCGDTSEVLSTLIFDKFGVIPRLVRGENSKLHEDFGSHVWLEVDNLIIDITLDQFNNYGYDFPAVYVDEISDFHRSFTSVVEVDGRHTQSRYKSILNSIYHIVNQGLESQYDV